MDYALHAHQELIMVQLHLEKAYDLVNWFFVSGLMHITGFGPCMSHLIFFITRRCGVSVMLKGGVTLDIIVTRYVRQGCSLCPLFAIVTHPLLVMLSKPSIKKKNSRSFGR